MDVWWINGNMNGRKEERALVSISPNLEETKLAIPKLLIAKIIIINK